MPWSRLRTPRSGDTTGGPRRHSTIYPLSHQNDGDHNANNDALPFGHDAFEYVKTPSPLRNSFEPSAVEQAPSATERAQSPMLLGQPPKRQRFSMLRYRHASDPQVDLPLRTVGGEGLMGALLQISKTARDHELAPVPPIPPGKLMDRRIALGGHNSGC